MHKLSIKALAIGCGVSWGIYMMFLGWVAAYGWGIQIVQTISSLYIGFTPTFLGGIIGGLWGFFDGAIGGAIFGWIYNLVMRKK